MNTLTVHYVHMLSAIDVIFFQNVSAHSGYNKELCLITVGSTLGAGIHKAPTVKTKESEIV